MSLKGSIFRGFIEPFRSHKKIQKGFKMSLLRKLFLLIPSLFLLGSNYALSAPITVDLADTTTSVTNVGTAIIGVVVVILGFSLVIGFLRSR